MIRLSSKRARLASFEHAYAVAIQMRRATGQDQFVVRTGDPIQPVCVTSMPPAETGFLLALVV